MDPSLQRGSVFWCQCPCSDIALESGEHVVKRGFVVSNIELSGLFAPQAILMSFWLFVMSLFSTTAHWQTQHKNLLVGGRVSLYVSFARATNLRDHQHQYDTVDAHGEWI